MVPIYLIARDRLTCLKNMVDYLLKLKDARVIIIDNASTYPALLEWYKSEPCEIIRLRRNGGQRVAYQFAEKEEADYYVVSDPDLDLGETPLDLLDVLREGLEKYPKVCKTGLGIRIDDLPESFKFSKKVRGHEIGFWIEPKDTRWFNAWVDTTFAMYRKGWKPTSCLRANFPYVCRHTSWYLDYDNLPEDEYYYLKHLRVNSCFWSVYFKYLVGMEDIREVDKKRAEKWISL
jgi:hypothetical protein